MDEIETVDRRVAVRGLSVLGVLMLAVGGSVVYRIVVAGPGYHAGPPLIAVSPPDPSTVDSPAMEAPSPEMAASEGTTVRKDEQVERTGFVEEAPAKAKPSSPRFVAPGDAEATSSVPPLAPPFAGGEAGR